MNIDLLINNSSDSISKNQILIPNKYGYIAKELNSILSIKNGFELFEGCMRFLPWDLNTSRNILSWNNYISSLFHTDLFFFSDNVLGEGFCFKGYEIGRFDFETCEFEFIASNMENFIKSLFSDFNYFSAYSIGITWQRYYRKIGFDEVLMPKIPFVLGGDYDVNNLYLSTINKGLRIKNELYNKVKNINDGERVVFSDS
ncbi:hypothetical protein EV697_102415 [Bisgaardia hudsonensis]|uniref:DUF1851 domain-containing protein n=1 Tax=Bisgaardia hudsonensis TaxID=109472 RepID=A0A4R2N1U8_9PAST|nr:hypothetical protein [Bisgaardia hudsonensis]QLB12915.1 hypothetical protein A6A11_04480 [Bisgaardia hudsonensis]TCP13528.1 hypothetical protein EV697_102415 [Bisgaardia hudsonensis]